MFHNMGLCSRPGGAKAWKHFGPELDPGMRALQAVYIRPLGGEGFWKGDYGGGGPGRPPFWRTLVSPTERSGWTRCP